ncbi:receptor-like protein kinase FERONIA [Bidens hawaiensis]|uniref:receptor-like protein kinase FERONIA n=1 Tax=Bidens hawaiensis TaxID=980011 RepID=UPI00404A4EFF
MAALQLPMFCQIYLDEIRAATSDFAELEKIRADGFGTIYRGEILYGTNRVPCCNQALERNISSDGWFRGTTHLQYRFAPGFKDFYVEVNALSNLRPCKLVSLTGYCDGATEKVLVYEMVENGNLDNHLHMHGTDLYWYAEASNLHHCWKRATISARVLFRRDWIIHGDFKTANVPLTQNWTSKVSDFGFARFCSKFPISEVPTQVKGIEIQRIGETNAIMFMHSEPGITLGELLDRKENRTQHGIQYNIQSIILI